MRHSCLAVALVAALAAFGVSSDATAELNLWVSYNFGGVDTYYDGEFVDSEKLLLQALDETTKKNRLGDTHERLGAVYAALGRFQEAEQQYQQALQLKEESLGHKHRELASILNNIGDLQYLLQKTEETESYYRRALEINTRDQFSLEVGRSLNGLAILHNDEGEYVEAENHLKRAIEIHDKGQRRNNPYLATALTNLGILYTNLGRYAEAEPQFERAKYIHDAGVRVDHPDVAVRLHATAALYQATGRVNEAITLANEAEGIREKQRANGNLY